MIVNYLFESLSPGGGTEVVYRHAAWAIARGHGVTLVAARPRLKVRWSPGGSLTLRGWVYRRFLGRAGETLRRYGVSAIAREVPQIEVSTVPSADVTVATSFVTAEWLAHLPERVGARTYFLQDYEAWTPELEPRVDATWRLPFTRLAVSQWLADLGRERLGVECRGPIGNGVDCEHFHPPTTTRDRGPATIGAVYDRRSGKAHERLVEALAMIAEHQPDTRFLLFGRTRLHHALPRRSRYVWNPSGARIPELYRQMDVFLHASTREGWGMPPMEAMASGCAVVATRSGGVPEFADDSCARLVAAGDAAALAEAALGLIAQPEERVTLGAAARERMRHETWERVYMRMETELLRAAGKGGAS